MNKQENVLVIGNGFDIYHYLPTRYIDFLRIVNRLIELDELGEMSRCQYIKYILGQKSPIYDKDEYIQECYNVHTQNMQSIELNQVELQKLVNISKNNLWIKYFQKCLEKDIDWIDFEREISNVLSAVQNLFKSGLNADNLVNGIPLSHISTMDLKTIDILKSMPFVENDNWAFAIKERYCIKGFDDDYYVSINNELILKELEKGLSELAEALFIYMKEIVQKIAIAKSADNPVFQNVDKILSFNYTDTYRKLYNSDVEVKFIHGSIDDVRGIILGISNDEQDELDTMDVSLIKFKKYYQRAVKDTFYSVDDFLNDENTEYNVSIVGHSINVTDRDILVGLMEHPRTKITIYYHNETAHAQQVVNLISLVGKKEFDKLRNSKKVKFRQLMEFKEAT